MKKRCPWLCCVSYLALLCMEGWASSLQLISKPGYCGKMQFVTAEVGWCTDYTTLQKTIDGGLTWRVVNTPPTSALDSLHLFQFLGPNHGWVLTTKSLY